MIYIVTGVHAGTHYKANFHEASDYKLSSVFFCKFVCVCVCVCVFFFLTEYHFYLNYLDRQACANSVDPNQMLQNSI